MHSVRPFTPHARRCASMASVGGRNCAGYCAGLGSNRIAALAGVKKTPTNQAASDCIVIKHASTAERRESLTPVGFGYALHSFGFDDVQRVSPCERYILCCTYLIKSLRGIGGRFPCVMTVANGQIPNVR